MLSEIDTILNSLNSRKVTAVIPEKIVKSIQSSDFAKTLTYWRNYSVILSEDYGNYRIVRSGWDLIYDVWKNKNDDFFFLNEKDFKKLEITDHFMSGILSYFGYRTKVKQEIRRVILEELYNAFIPRVNNYYEWAGPKSKDRHEKIRLTLSGLAFPHRKQKIYEAAVKVWDDDYDFFINNIKPYS